MKQSERSKKWLIDALLQLMEKKRFEDITITDITEKAGVSRLTFYRNFESKEAILQQHYDYEFRAYLEMLNDTDNIDLEHALIQCYAFWKRCAGKKKLLIKNNLMNVVFKPFDQYLKAVLELTHLENQFSHYQKKFIVGGLYFSMISWIEEDRDIRPDEIAKEILSLIEGNRDKRT